MKIVIQRVNSAKVTVNREVRGSIGKGLLLLICFECGDEVLDLNKVVSKILALRVFPDQNTGKMSLNLSQMGGAILAVSQFTLSWDGRKGNRPSFDGSMASGEAEKRMNELCELFRGEVPLETGVFGAHMDISLENDGPVTFVLNF